MAITEIRIRNWEKWQSYRRDRGQPPWIKVHRRLMQDPDWMTLSDSQKGQLVVIWMLAADRNGVIATPGRRQLDAKAASRLVAKLGQMDAAPDLELFAELGFITLDANVTPTRRQDDVNVTPQRRGEERRGEEELEREQSTTTKTSDTIPVDNFKKPKPLKQTPTQMIQSMAAERGVTVELYTKFRAPPWTRDQITEAKAWLLTLTKRTEEELDQLHRGKAKRRTKNDPAPIGDVLSQTLEIAGQTRNRG